MDNWHKIQKNHHFFQLGRNFFTRYLKNLLPPEAPCFLFFAFLLSKNKKKLASLIYKNKKIWTTDTRFKKTTTFFNNKILPEASCLNVSCFLFFVILLSKNKKKKLFSYIQKQKNMYNWHNIQKNNPFFQQQITDRGSMFFSFLNGNFIHRYHQRLRFPQNPYQKILFPHHKWEDCFKL